jgi:hypothetical protein
MFANGADTFDLPQLGLHANSSPLETLSHAAINPSKVGEWASRATDPHVHPIKNWIL